MNGGLQCRISIIMWLGTYGRYGVLVRISCICVCVCVCVCVCMVNLSALSKALFMAEMKSGLSLFSPQRICITTQPSTQLTANSLAIFASFLVCM